MKKILALSTGLLLGAMAFSPAMAEDININITEETCANSAELQPEVLGLLLVWMDGYLSAKEGVIQFELEEVKALSESLAAYCEENPDDTLLNALQNSE